MIVLDLMLIILNNISFPLINQHFTLLDPWALLTFKTAILLGIGFTLRSFVIYGAGLTFLE